MRKQRQPVDPAAIEAEVARIRTLGIQELRSAWRSAFGPKPPASLSKDILGRMLAWRVQEHAFGGHDREVLKVLAGYLRGEKPRAEPRKIKPGSVLVREYAGERHTVTVMPDGFLWREQTYASLSTIAQAITGTSWNGPRFFGLRRPERRGAQDGTLGTASGGVGRTTTAQADVPEASL